MIKSELHNLLDSDNDFSSGFQNSNIATYKTPLKGYNKSGEHSIINNLLTCDKCAGAC